MMELGLDAEGLTETVLHLNLFCFVLFCFPYDETKTEILLRHQHQDRRQKENTRIIKTETSLHLNLGKTWGFFKNYYPLSVSNA
jgi:hypothetical protein